MLSSIHPTKGGTSILATRVAAISSQTFCRPSERGYYGQGRTKRAPGGEQAPLRTLAPGGGIRRCADGHAFERGYAIRQGQYFGSLPRGVGVPSRRNC